MSSAHTTPWPHWARTLLALWLLGLWLLCGLSACASYSHTNRPLAAAAAVASEPTQTRATFSVGGERGNPRVLMFLALSGGGSRAAYFSAATMLRLQTLYPDVDLLNEVDVMSSVSGGSMTAALYAATRDVEIASPLLVAALPAVLADTPLAARIKIDAPGQTLRCTAPLQAGELIALNAQMPSLSAELRRLDMLCRQAPLTHLRDWERPSVLSLTSRNYLMRWFGNWFWPTNIARYWFTAYDRADIMAQTLADNLYGTRFLGVDLSLGELNPTRPYLLINATTAADQDAPGINAADEYAFGSVFSFTEQDFRDRLNSDDTISPFSVLLMECRTRCAAGRAPPQTPSALPARIGAAIRATQSRGTRTSSSVKSSTAPRASRIAAFSPRHLPFATRSGRQAMFSKRASRIISGVASVDSLSTTIISAGVSVGMTHCAMDANVARRSSARLRDTTIILTTKAGEPSSCARVPWPCAFRRTMF